MPKKKQPKELAYAGYLNLSLSDADYDKIDEQMGGEIGHEFGFIYGIMLQDFGIKMYLKDGKPHAATFNLKDLHDDGAQWYITSYGETWLECLMIAHFKLTNWQRDGFVLPEMGGKPRRG